MTRRAKGRPGRKGGIHVHDVAQSSLAPEHPWPVKHAKTDVGTRVVAQLEQLVESELSPVERLEHGWHVFQGIQTGADAYTRRIDKRLTREARTQLAAAGAHFGDPILELPAGLELKLPWSQHPELLVRAPEPWALLYGAIDEVDYVSVVMLDANQPPTDVLAALDRWRPLLATRAEIARNARRRWWETAWRRDTRALSAPKVITINRTDRGRFALDETGEWQLTIKCTAVTSRSGAGPVAYLCGLLNSELLDLWYAVRGRTPWHVRRNYEPKRMNEIPYRQPEGDPRAKTVTDLVRALAANRRALLPHRAVVRDLARIVKDPWKAGPVDVDRAAVIRELPESEVVSVRLDPELDARVGDPPLGRPHRLDERTLVFRRGNAETARITGENARIDLLAELTGGKAPDDLRSVLLPRDLKAFEKRMGERANLVGRLLAEGRRMVEEVERLVCALYDVQDDLTEEVVAHAVVRAGRTA